MVADAPIKKHDSWTDSWTEKYIKKSEERDNDIARYGGEIELLTPSLQDAEKNRAHAEIIYNESQKYKRSLIDRLVLPEGLRTPFL